MKPADRERAEAQGQRGSSFGMEQRTGERREERKRKEVEHVRNGVLAIDRGSIGDGRWTWQARRAS
jgi:hypothetical protein